MTRRLRSTPLPLALLAVLSVLSLGARIAWLGEPCHAPCRTGSNHVLVFDESYYVNAARVIAGIAPPPNEEYATAPLGDDPNAEHPQLAKLLMAGSIELFGDGPLAWRLPSLLLGSLAILGMFALVRAAGGGPWLALGAAALMATDNLLLVHGRIGTLDVPVLAAMLWAAVLYLRGHPLLAGVLVGVGCTIKIVAPYVLVVFLFYEAGRVLVSERRGAARAGPKVSAARAAGRLGGCAAVAAGVFITLLALLDRIAPPYDSFAAKLVTGGPFGHIGHILSYGANQTSPHGPTGIASYPWTWIVDYKPIVYLNVNPSKPSPGLIDVHPTVHFLGMMSPPLMLLALPALVFAGWAVVRRWRGLPSGTEAAGAELPLVGISWFLGTFLPFGALSALFSRTSYLYYMVVVMPGIYIAVVCLLFGLRRFKKLIAAWATLVVVAAIVMYPLLPLPLP
jgi:dolichyl-phosphate-mannose-protein mannosyltransferase